MIEALRGPMERYLHRIWYRGTPPPRWLGWLETGYRRLLGSSWQRPRRRPARPVIVVGNLTAGGAGKTPVVIALVRHLLEKGWKTGVISRGYGGAEPSTAETVTPDDSPERAGDEPVLIAISSGAPVWICRYRDRALKAALEAGCEVVVADDGLQHAALPRSLELCVIDGQRGLGNGHLLPAGPLRQPVDRLDQTDLVLVKGGGFRYPTGHAYALEAVGLAYLDGGPAEALNDWSGRCVDAVCGIAHPEQFAATLAGLGIDSRLRAFPDHHRYSATDITALAGPVITTEKDAVKLARLPIERTVRVLKVEARLPQAALDGVDQHLEEFEKYDGTH